MPQCRECGGLGHELWNCPTIDCYRCRQKGHVARNCPSARSRAMSPARNRSSERPRPTSNAHRLPTHWTLHAEYEGSISEAIKGLLKAGKKFHMERASDSERREVGDLAIRTWRQDLVGYGVDARNLSHDSIQIVKVERIENPEKYEKYSQRKQTLLRPLRDAEVGESVFTPVDRIPGSSGAVLTTRLMDRDTFLRGNIYPKINEHYLFHGTKEDYVVPIARDGMDNRFGNQRSLLGPGIYTAESSTKSDQYSDAAKDARTNGEKKMFLVRVLLGEPYLSEENKPPRFLRPPCRSCQQVKCDCKHSGQYDSVVDDAGRLFREFVVYEQCQCYPEYLITYRRVSQDERYLNQTRPAAVHKPVTQWVSISPAVAPSKQPAKVPAANITAAAATTNAASAVPAYVSGAQPMVNANHLGQIPAQNSAIPGMSRTRDFTSSPAAKTVVADSASPSPRVSTDYVWTPTQAERGTYDRGIPASSAQRSVYGSCPSPTFDCPSPSFKCPSTSLECPSFSCDCSCADGASCGNFLVFAPLTVCSFLVILGTLGVALAMTVMGFLNAGQCPASKFLPVYMQLVGLFAILGFLLAGAASLTRDSELRGPVYFSLGLVALAGAALQVAGWVVVFGFDNGEVASASPSNSTNTTTVATANGSAAPEPKGDNHCHPDFFHFAWAASIVQMVLYVLCVPCAVFLQSMDLLQPVMKAAGCVCALVVGAAAVFLLAAPLIMTLMGSIYMGDCDSFHPLPKVLLGLGVVCLVLEIVAPVCRCVLDSVKGALVLVLCGLVFVASTVTCQGLGYAYLYPYNAQLQCNSVLYHFAYAGTALINIYYVLAPTAVVGWLMFRSDMEEC